MFMLNKICSAAPLLAQLLRRADPRARARQDVAFPQCPDGASEVLGLDPPNEPDCINPRGASSVAGGIVTEQAPRCLSNRLVRKECALDLFKTPGALLRRQLFWLTPLGHFIISEVCLTRCPEKQTSAIFSPMGIKNIF